MSDDDWGDDDDDWGDDAGGDDDGDWGKGANDEWDDNAMEFEQMEDEFANNQQLSEVEQLFEEADSLMSLRRKPDALAEFKKFLEASKKDNHPKPQLLLEALSKMVQLCVDLEQKEESVRYYKELLSCLKDGSHSQNEKKTAISDVLSQFDLGRNKVAEDFYILTIDSIRDDERLWFDFSIELSHSYLELKKWDMLNPLIEQLHDACKKDGVDDTSKADLLIQIYAVKIEQMFATGNTEQLESIYHLTKRLSANVGDHRSAPILAEFNGKYHAEQRDFQKSYAEFFQAIKYADPDRGKLCVKYLVCVTMLGEENTDPFASREVKIYETDRTVAPMVKLYHFFNENNIKEFDDLVKYEEEKICADPFISKLIPAIRVKLRKKTLVAILKPYRKVKLKWLAEQLYYDMSQTENLLIGMILDKSILARINQVDQTLEIRKSQSTVVYNQLKAWMRALTFRQQNLCSQIGRLEYMRPSSVQDSFMS